MREQPRREHRRRLAGLAQGHSLEARRIETPIACLASTPSPGKLSKQVPRLLAFWVRRDPKRAPSFEEVLQLERCGLWRSFERDTTTCAGMSEQPTFIIVQKLMFLIFANILMWSGRIHDGATGKIGFNRCVDTRVLQLGSVELEFRYPSPSRVVGIGH